MSTTHRRTNKFPKPRIQLRLIGGFIGVAALALFVQNAYLGLLLLRHAAALPVGGEDLREASFDLVVQAGLVSLLVLVPLTAFFGVLITFRTAGPIYRFEQHLQRVIAGERPGPCRIRERDELQEMCGLLNQALETARREGEEDAARRRSA